jgi:hypothetical protein
MSGLLSLFEKRSAISVTAESSTRTSVAIRVDPDSLDRSDYTKDTSRRVHENALFTYGSLNIRIFADVLVLSATFSIQCPAEEGAQLLINAD